MKTSPGVTQTMPSTAMERGEWRKRYVYFKLESETSISTDNDTESVYSVQNRETDVARDTSDTDSKSEVSTSTDKFEVELEYDVASLSGDDFPFANNFTSSDTEDLQAAEGAIAAVLCDSSLEAWATDRETSDSSSDNGVVGLTDFWMCVQCKSTNHNHLFRYCEKCFQDRKNFFPPRPRGHRKRKLVKMDPPPVKLDTLKSCLNRLTQESASGSTFSQDSGLGSSQEIGKFGFDQIVLPSNKNKRTAASSAAQSSSEDEPAPKRSKLTSENLRNHTEILHKSNENNPKLNELIDSGTELSKSSTTSDDSTNKNNLTDQKELCIMCNIYPKNGIFLHGNIGHCCCCYKCAIKSWKVNKRCPICNCKVKNVVKLFY